MYDKTIPARNLRVAMAYFGIDQKTLARACGITQGAISNMCTGKFDMLASTVYCICRTLGISADWLLGFYGTRMIVHIDTTHAPEELDRHEVSDKLRSRWLQMAITRKELSEKLEICEQQLYGYLYRKCAPRADKLYKVCDAMGVTADWVLGLTE